MTGKKGFVPENYNPVDYWNTRDQPNTEKNPGVSPAHASYFNRNVPPGMRILEVGPGIGRLFPLYRDALNGEFSTIDIASQHRAAVEAAADAQGLRVHQTFVTLADASYPFADNAFDIGVSSYVFIHVPFEFIRHSMLELTRVASRVIIYASDNPAWAQSEADRKPSTHCFNHNYPALCAELGLKVYDRIEFTKNRDLTPTAFTIGKP
jgi:hypothetical protein